MIECKEIVQAGSVFLLRFDCPKCGHEQFAGYPLSKCSTCDVGLQDQPLDLDARRRLVVGSFRVKGRVSKRLVQSLFGQQDGLCAYCRVTLSGGYHVEHIVPLCVGGTNGTHNLILACPPCNHTAGGKAFSNFATKQAYILAARKQYATNPVQ
jgi:5-methylcytosine-specific restriction endonuclease McrA